MLYLPRAVTGTIRRAMATFPAVLMTGARQSGKTTLLRREFQDSHRYISLERPDVRLRAQNDPVAFFQDHPPPLILDEIQHATGLLPYIKDRIDEERIPGAWLITGSQRFPLMQGVSETLAGRVALLDLDPLSVGEVVRSPVPASVADLIARVFDGPSGAGASDLDAPDVPGFADWLLRGGYPEIRLHPDVDRQIWFSSYVQTYLERDVRDLVQVGDLGSFSRFLSLVASRTGTLLNATELGRETGVSGPTVKRWLSVLEASHILYLLRPYHRNFGKRVRKSPKLFFLDAGLAAFLQGLHSVEAVLQGPSLGALTETAIVAEWIKTIRQMGERAELFFWKAAGDLEVDLVIDHGGHLYGIEVKATATPTPRHAEALSRWLKLAGPAARGVLACRIDRPIPLRPGIRAVPWHLAW
jgi:predicted AAA+ superfamily ATPase